MSCNIRTRVLQIDRNEQFKTHPFDDHMKHYLPIGDIYTLYFFYPFFFDMLVSLSLLLILRTTGYIYLNLACVYVANTAP